MATFDPFDKKAASAQAARDREVADRAKKMQAEMEARRKQQLLKSDITKLQGEIARRKQEATTLEQEVERTTRSLEQKKKEVSEVDRDLQQIEKRIPEEDRKLKTVSTLFENIASALKGIRTKLSALSTQEKKEEESVQNKRALLATATQKKEILQNDYNRLDAAIKKTKSDVDKEKKDLVQKQTLLLKTEHEQQVLDQSMLALNQKIRELEREVQTLKATLASQIQNKARIDSEHLRDAQVVQNVLQSTQSKDAELYRLTQEYDRVRRELDQQKDLVGRLETALVQDEGVEKRDEESIAQARQEAEKLQNEEKAKRDEIEKVQSEYQRDVALQKKLQSKKIDALSHISSESSVLQQKQLRIRNVETELKKFEAELQQKERELGAIRF